MFIANLIQILFCLMVFGWVGNIVSHLFIVLFYEEQAWEEEKIQAGQQLAWSVSFDAPYPKDFDPSFRYGFFKIIFMKNLIRFPFPSEITYLNPNFLTVMSWWFVFDYYQTYISGNLEALETFTYLILLGIVYAISLKPVVLRRLCYG